MGDIIMKYRDCKIPKKGGKFRKISIPDKELLTYQRKRLYGLQKIYEGLVEGTVVQDTVHGFLKGRNVVTLAEQHVGFKATIMMDLSDFFDTVTKDMMPKDHPEVLDENLYHKDGYTAQGFSTSPLLANIAAIGLTTKIKDHLIKKFPDHAFGFYADDITISVNTISKVKLNGLVKAVGKLIESEGFKVNTKKTRIKYAKFGFRRILGINVGDDAVRATRKTMRRIRAAEHQSNWSSLGGLVNWSNCNKPNLDKNKKK